MIDDFVARGDEDLLAVAKIIRGSRRRSRAGIVARTLWWTHRSIFLVALRGVLAEDDREQLVLRLRVAADRAYDQLAGGLGEYGKGG